MPCLKPYSDALKRVVLGTDPHQAVRASQALLALTFLLLCAAAQHGEVMLGLMDLQQSNVLTAFYVSAGVCWYVLIRTRLNLRIAPGDPSLTVAQTLSAVIAVSWSYGITGPARGALLVILILIFMFATLFQLSPSQARKVGVFAMVLLVSVMVWRSFWAVQRYDPRVEFVHFVFTTIVVSGAIIVSSRLGQLRYRLSAQKLVLKKALELNRQLASRDGLTGLLNRRAMTELLAEEEGRGRQRDVCASLALLDIDHFKRVNDTYGHNVGDAVLERFSQVATAEMRAGDLLARWGGEEFLLVMPGTGIEQAHALLQRLRDRIAVIGFDELAPDLKISFSAGLTEMAAGELQEAAVDRADKALYLAKREGRDRLEVKLAA